VGAARNAFTRWAPLLTAAPLAASCAFAPYRRALARGDEALHEGRYEAARRLYGEAAKKAADWQAPADLARARHASAACALLLGRPADAESDYRAALDALQAAGAPASDRAATLGDLANALALEGRPSEAAAAYRKAAAEYAKAPDASALERSKTLAELGQLELAQRRYPEAEQAYSEAISLRERALGDGHPSLGPLLEDLASALTGQGKLREAESAQRRAKEIRER